MRNQLRILVLSEAINRVGGVEKYILDLVASLGNQLGHENVLLVSVSSFQNVFLRRICTLIALFYYSLRFSPNYIFCGYIYLSFYVVIISKFFRIPYIMCTYGIEVWRDLPVWQIQALKDAIRIITISRYTKQKLIEKGIDDKRIFLIHPRVDINRFNNIYNTKRIRLAYNIEGKKILMTVGRMVSNERYKGHDELISVMPDIIKKISNVVFLIIGGGDDVERLQGLCKSLRLEDHVIFAGKVRDDELPFYYNACDVFVMPSRVILKDDGRWGGEGFGIVFLEASACGKPVIGANSGGTLDAVVDQETGILVDPTNKKSLIEAIIKLLSNLEYADRLGKNGRVWVKKFDIKQLPLLVRELFEDLGEKCVV